MLHSERAEHARMPAGPALLGSAVPVRKALPVYAEERHLVYSEKPVAERTRERKATQGLSKGGTSAQGVTCRPSHHSEDRRLGDSLLKRTRCFHVGHLATPCRHGCARLLPTARAARDPWLPGTALIRAWRSYLRAPSYSWAHACEQAAYVVLANAGQVTQGARQLSSGSLRTRRPDTALMLPFLT